MSDIFWVMFEIVINIFQGMICAYFVKEFLGKKEYTNTKVYYLLCGGLHSILITVLNRLSLFEGIDSFLYILELFIFAVIMLKGNIIKKAIASVLPLCIGFAISMFTANYFSAVNQMSIEGIINEKSYIRIISVFATQILYYLCFKLILKLLKSAEDRFVPHDWIMVLVVIAATIILMALIHMIAIRSNDSSQRLYINLSILVILGLNVLVMYFIDTTIKRAALERQVELLMLQKHYHQQYIDGATIQYDSIKKIRHDLKNNYATINELLKNGDIEAAITLTSQNNEQLRNTETYLNTNNSIVNAVVNSKLNSASALGIEVSCISPLEISGVEDLDLCNLLSNVLDNAVTACIEQSSEMPRQILLNISSEDDTYKFVIKNSVDSSVLRLNPELRTSKLEHDMHGYGLKIINDIAQKYNGRCDIFEQDNTFCVQVYLQRKQDSSM